MASRLANAGREFGLDGDSNPGRDASQQPSIRYSVKLLLPEQHHWSHGRSHSGDASILMSEILLYYKRPDPTTWVYLSSFLTIGLFFVFHRFWSIRNLDIVLLILLSPGLLIVHEGRRRELAEIAAAKESGTRPTEAQSASIFRGASDALGSMSSRGPIQLTSVNGAAGEAQLSTDETAQGATFPNNQVDSPADQEGVLANAEPEKSVEPDTGPGDEAEVESAETAGDDIAAPTDETAELAESNADPGYMSREIQRWGFMYLLFIQSLILLRLMLDPIMSRRPLLDPNLTTGGLNFIGISLFIFMMANVVASTPGIQVSQGPELGPGYALMRMLPAIPTRPVTTQPGGALPVPAKEPPLTPSQQSLATVAKVLAILAHAAIVSGIVLISNRHFSNLRAGVGCATLYLMLPYTAQMTGRVDHALPAALLLWAVLCYRKPFIAGMFLGLAGGLVYYPLFLLPLWLSFYWQRGVRNFIVGTVSMLAILMLALAFDDSSTLTNHLRHMFGLLNPNRSAEAMRGLWSLGWNPIWRLPVIVAFVILSAFFAIWPAQKNLGTLLSGSAALMVAAQFWHGESGGLYIAWFLPLLLLTVFRPNLQDRVATKVVVGGKPSRSSRRELEAV